MNDNLLASRLSHLDIYKGVAILFIIFTHFEWNDTDRKTLLFPFWIDMAVPIFMVISGYVMSLSYERKYASLPASYKPIEIILKWLRFIIPFIPAWILTVIARIIGKNESFSIGRILLDFITGGTGPGSYYFPVMLQVVLLIPLIIYIVKKNPIRGFFFCFTVNVLFEAIKTILKMSPELYRICSFRYIFILSYGCFLYYYREIGLKNSIWIYSVGVIGLVYIVIFNYTEAQPIITDLWTSTSVFAAMFIVPIMMVLIDRNAWHCKLLETLGKASFNIFLVQMVFYLAGDELVYKHIPTVPLKLAVIIIICCVFGVLYYKIGKCLKRWCKFR